MLEFICLFFPPVLGLAIIEHLLKRKFSNKALLFLYVWFCLSSNLIVFIIKFLFFQTADASFFNISVNTALRYIPLALLATCLVAYFTTLFFKKTELTLETKEEDNEEQETEKTDE